MSEETPRRSSHRAAGPVDAGTYVRREVDPNLSPRRRARMQAQAAEQQSAPAAPPMTDGAKDLLTSWLKANGFEDLESFQEMTRRAESQLRQTPPPGDTPAPSPALSAENPVSRSLDPANLEVPSSLPPRPSTLPRRATRSAVRQGVQTPAAASRQLDLTSRPVPAGPDVALPVVSPEAPAVPSLAVADTPAQVAALPEAPVRDSVLNLPPEVVPTVSLRREDVQNLAVAESKKPKTHSPRRAAKLRRAASLPRTPKPLAKTKVVPIALTLGILLALSVALLLLIMWYRSAVAVSDPAKSKIEVLGAIGAQPVLTLSEPIPLEKSSTELLIKGRGQQIKDDSIVALRVTVFSGMTGKLQSTSGDESVLVGPLSAKVFGTELYNAVRGATEGSRYLLKQPVEQQGTSTMEIGVIDIIPTSLNSPMTALPPDAGLSVSEDQGQVRLAILSDFSGDFRFYPLITGSGATVAPGQTVLVKYQEFSYSNPPALLKDHWSEPVKLKLDDKVQQGVARGIVDRKIGSRMLLEVPPAEGSGNQATILVVDILAAWDNPEVTKES
ncbi:hypothetical protein [uncultured Mobiluncus sp.]|uniref:hypothetical protein n=1 Tax=uncultured Mobiluncus sp. TaxID=293425 RepID=UPI0025DF2FD1|nr:hypothetical protein [uncultured Mobiluncus sp.]